MDLINRNVLLKNNSINDSCDDNLRTIVNCVRSAYVRRG